MAQCMCNVLIAVRLISIKFFRELICNPLFIRSRRHSYELDINALKYIPAHVFTNSASHPNGCSQVDEVGGDDWFALPQHDPMLRASRTSMKGSDGRKKEEHLVCTVALKAGDMLLWDSRTVHCSSPGSDGRPIADGNDFSETVRNEAQSLNDADGQGADAVYAPKGHSGAPLLRAAVMVCMAPVDQLARAAAFDRKRTADASADSTATAANTICCTSTKNNTSAADEAFLSNLFQQRKEAVEQGWTTPHWPHKATPLLEQYHEEVVGTGEAEQQRLLRSPVAERLTYNDLGLHERSLVDGVPHGAAL